MILNGSKQRQPKHCRLLFAAIICLCFSIARSEQPRAKTEDAFSDKIDQIVQDRMYREMIPGLALAVIKDGKILKEQGYGVADVDSKIPVTTDTVFRIASISKQFVATAIMMLVEEGRLNLDDPVSKHLDNTPRKWKKVTIRHLLTHTSAIPDFINENIPVDTNPDAFDQSVFRAVAQQSLHFTPGGDWRYSNSNYHLLGMIIRKITGKTYGEFLHGRVFEPLEMTRTMASPQTGTAASLASGYKWNDGIHPGDDVAPAIKAYAGGGLLSTISDLVKWNAALDTERLLKESSREQMWTPVRLDDGMTFRYGLGWGVGRINDRLIVSHGGNFSGFSTFILRAVDDRLTVIILDNRFNSEWALAALAYKIASLYRSDQREYQPVPDLEPKVTARVREILDRCGRGNLRAADFTAAVWTELSPLRKQMRQDGKTYYGPVQSLTLVERDIETDRQSHRYRIQYKFGTVLLHVVFDGQNKIAVWKVEDVDLK